MAARRLLLALLAAPARPDPAPCSLPAYSRENNRWAEYQAVAGAAQAADTACRKEAGCSACHDSVIKRDLAPWAGGVSRQLVDRAAALGRATRYQVIGHRLYRSQDCMFPARCQGVEHFLLNLLPDLPDTEFVVNVRDWPLAPRHGPALPVFSFSKVPTEHWDILYPAWAFWAGGPAIQRHPRGLGRWDLLRDSLASAAAALPWEAREERAFFRGSRTSAERDPLVRLSRRCPEVADAAYTTNQGWRSEADTLGSPPVEEVALEDHCHFTMLVNYRGVAASFRLKHLFLCRSLVLHVGEDWQEFFYPALKYVALSSRIRG
jgi:protein glucosyltransferase